MKRRILPAAIVVILLATAVRLHQDANRLYGLSVTLIVAVFAGAQRSVVAQGAGGQRQANLRWLSGKKIRAGVRQMQGSSRMARRALQFQEVSGSHV